VVGEEQVPVEACLRGRRVLVADDAADVRWFYVGLLRQAGARVIEARDGAQALELAREEPPNLILADIVMPRLDGLALCAAVRREPSLDGVPVVLLSWQDDFLHRLRELGADAQEYLRKEVPPAEILERLSTLLEPLDRLEAALRSAREARGDLEELGVSALLRATRRLRPNASIIVQDPWSLFEIELQEGKIVEVTRTGVDGALTRGAGTFPALVGMSSGRFIVTEIAGRRSDEDSASLEASFRQATRRLGLLLSTMAEHPDCHVELDEDVLGAYVRHSPIGVQRMVARLVAGEPIQALWESEAASRSLVDALLVTLARQGAVRNVMVPADPGDVLIESEIEPDSRTVADPLERENIRAQLSVAMHREPANEAPRWSYPIWRLNPGARAGNPESNSGFEMEMKTTPRVLGLGFAFIFSATVGFLLWRQLVPAPEPMAPPAVATAPAAEALRDEPVPRRAPPQAAPEGPAPIDLSEFAGVLRPGVDPSFGVGEGQGVLELLGPRGARVEVDGVDRGELPVTLVLDQGRHVVRARVGSGSSDRFYYVKSGATRTATPLNRPGGLVDAR